MQNNGAFLSPNLFLCLGFSLPLCSPRIFIYTIASSPGSAAVVLANSGGISHQVVQQSQTFDYSRNIGASFRYFYGNQRTSTTVELFWANLGTNATSLAIWASQFSVSARLESERYLSDSASVLATLSPSVSSDLHVLQFDKVWYDHGLTEPTACSFPAHFYFWYDWFSRVILFLY